MDEGSDSESVHSEDDRYDGNESDMTSTLEHRKSAPLPLGGLGAHDDDVESLGSSVPEDIDLKVILPDGTEKVTTVKSSKQMLDLAVWLSANNRLSPANHTLAIYNPETGRPLEYKASQMIGALHVDTVHLVNKKANKDKSKRHTVAQPFEMTNRLTVNLPKNQKTVIRISPLATLADIFKTVCKEKSLDPYKHELRHPTQPDMALNMASPLNAYNITEISVVNVTAPDQPPSQTQTGTVKSSSSIYDKHWSYNNMPQKKNESQQSPPGGSGEQQQAYMPGMTEKKKKKGIMSLFSRKKEGKFKLSDTTYTAPSMSAPPLGYEQPITNGNKPQAEVKPQPQQAKIIPQSSTSDLKDATLPTKPHRKKRQAPAPPGTQVGATKPLSVNTETPSNSTHTVHSRGSSHSSGFDETNMSPLESPGGSSGKSSNNTGNSAQTKTSADIQSSDSSGIVAGGRSSAQGTVKATIVEEVHSAATSGVSRQSSISTGANSTSTGSLTRGKKKRRAPPPPPQGVSKPSSAIGSPTHSLTTGSEGSGSGPPSATQSPIHVAGVTTVVTVEAGRDDDDQEDVARELQMAIAEELKKEASLVQDTPLLTITQSDSLEGSTGTTGIRPPIERPCNFVAPPPPDSPPPPETPGREHDPPQFDLYNCQRPKVKVADISTQVHATLRDSLCSEVSSCDSCDMPDTPTDVSHNLDTATPDVPETITVHREPLERQKSDVAVFVEQMTELTENVKRQSESDTTPAVVHDDVSDATGTLNGVGADEVDFEHSDVFIESDEVQFGHVSVVKVVQDYDDEHLLHTDADSGTGAHVHEVGRVASLVDDTQQPTQQYKKAQPYFSDSSSDVESLSNFNLDEVATDSDEETDNTKRTQSELPDADPKVVLVKKKIVPAFTLEFGEDDVIGEELNSDYKKERDSKPSEMAAALTAFDMIEEENSNVVLESDDDISSQQDTFGNAHQHNHANSRVRVNLNDLHFQESDDWTDSGRESPQEHKFEVHNEGRESFTCDEEISFNNQEVVYVSPHSGQTESDIDKIVEHSPEPDDEDDIVTFSEWTETYTVSRSDAHFHEVQEPTATPPHESNTSVETISPPSGSSLYSIITGVKSRVKPKDTSSDEPVKRNTFVYSEEKEFEQKAPVEQPTFTSLRDAYKKQPPPAKEPDTIIISAPAKEPETIIIPPAPAKQPDNIIIPPAPAKQPDTIILPAPAKEPETIIIPKPQPYRIPPIGPRHRETELPKDASDATRKTAMKEARRPSADSKIQTELEPQTVPIVYKTASLAVSRRAPKVSAQDNVEKQEVETDGGGTRFWGPRPWSARSAEESLIDSNQALSGQQSHRQEQDNMVCSTPQKGRPNSTIGMYSPGKSSPIVDGSPKEKCTEISFSPRSEEEEIHNLMEEKSISMLAYPVEKKSILKVNKDEPASNTRRYNSSHNLSSIDTREGKIEKRPGVDHRMSSSTTGLSQLGIVDTVVEQQHTKPVIKETTHVSTYDAADTKEQAKKTLEEQYSDLHKQYAVWQRQLVDNQTLLAKKNLIATEKPEKSKSDPPPTNAESQPLLRKQVSLDAVEQQRALENYRRLNTPRPFSQKLEPHTFKPKPIMKKRLSLNERKESVESNKDADENENDSKSREVQNHPKIKPPMLSSLDSVQFSRSTSMDSNQPIEPETPDTVVHRTLTSTKSEPSNLIPQHPPLSKVQTANRKTHNSTKQSRFEPKLDPREELMIAIRSAGGRQALNKSPAVDTDW